MLTFNDQASVHVPLSRRGSVSVVPTLVARGSTHYGGVFRLLRNQIERDVRDIKAQGHRVYRPIVFFLTDGAPSDSSWLEAFESLSPTAFRLSPRIVAFGLGDASKADIARIGDAGAFQLQPQSELHIGRVIEGALRRMSATVTSSVSASETSWARPLKVLQDLPGLENVTVETTARKLDEDHWQRSDPDKQARGQGLANQLHDAIAKLEGELAAAKASGDAKNVARAQEALDARKVWLDALDS